MEFYHKHSTAAGVIADVSCTFVDKQLLFLSSRFNALLIQSKKISKLMEIFAEAPVIKTVGRAHL